MRATDLKRNPGRTWPNLERDPELRHHAILHYAVAYRSFRRLPPIATI
jgi:hypothetical protein